MNPLIVLLIIFLILSVVGLPHWGYSQHLGYGYWPSGVGFIVVVVLLVLLFRGRL